MNLPSGPEQKVEAVNILYLSHMTYTCILCRSIELKSHKAANKKEDKKVAVSYRKLAPDGICRRHNRACCVMLHHSGKLRQVSL